MSTRSAVLFGIGMLVLGLLLGLVTGGVAGFFMARSNRVAVSQNVNPFQSQPFPNQQFPRNRDNNNLPPSQSAAVGARVISVEDSSPAASAGLQAGDVITAVDNTKIDDNHSLGDLIQTHKPGDKIALSVARANQNLTLNVQLGQAPQDANSAYLGIRFSPALGNPRRFQNPSAIPNG